LVTTKRKHRIALANIKVKKSRIIFITIGLILVVGIYQTFYPGDSFYSEEFELATSLSLPNSANLIEGQSDWGLTCAIHEISSEDWGKFTKPLLNRANRNHSIPTSFYPELLDKLDGQADVFVLTTDRRYVFVGLDKSNRQIFWEVWHN